MTLSIQPSGVQSGAEKAGSVVPAGVPEEVAFEWEAFLESQPRGQYQQSVRWGWVKEGDGWRCRLETWGCGGQLAGGFLLLIKRTRLGRLGFVNKGPVLAEETPETVSAALDRVVRVALEERLQALIVQPPDASAIGSDELWGRGFCKSPVPGIIDATLVASLEGGSEGILHRLSRSARRELRLARERGVRVVEGGPADLPAFFELMCLTCRRQGARPNPSSVEALRRRWTAFGSNMRLLLALVGDELVAGLSLLRFGERCTFEKKGWNGRHAAAFPNTLLNVEAMFRAAEWGCRVVDFCAIDRSLAERMLGGQSVDEDLAKTRHAFNVRLGARPVLLPPALVRARYGWQRCWLDWLLARAFISRRLAGSSDG